MPYLNHSQVMRRAIAAHRMLRHTFRNTTRPQPIRCSASQSPPVVSAPIDKLKSSIEVLFPSDPSTLDVAPIRNELLTRMDKLLVLTTQKLEEFIIFLEQNQTEISKSLQQADLTSLQLVSQLRDIMGQLQATIERTKGSQNLVELKGRTESLQFIYQEMLHHPTDPKRTLLTHTAYIVEVEIKLESFITRFMNYEPKAHIANTHPSLHEQAWKRIEMRPAQNPEKIKEGYKSVEQLLHSLSAAVTQSEQYSNTRWEDLVFGVRLPINLIKQEWAILQSLQFYRNPNVRTTRKWLNIYEQGFLKTISELSFPSITTNKLIYVPTEATPVDSTDSIFVPAPHSIPVRILHHARLPTENDPITEQDIVVHMHGGGFLGLSSHTMQNYTRHWAKGLKMPFFSIDYRQPPQHPFPQPPQDCLTVYNFLMNQLEKHIPIRPRRIYLCGDSAGGNLACGLTVLLFKQKIKLPAGLFLAFPTLDVRMTYYPSRKLILNDPLLWPSLAELFFTTYAPSEHGSNPVASPLLLQNQHINPQSRNPSSFPDSWPPTYMTVGSLDPLRDETLVMIQRMAESGVECRLVVFQGLRHALYSTQAYMKQSREALEESLSLFQQLVVLQKQKDKSGEE